MARDNSNRRARRRARRQARASASQPLPAGAAAGAPPPGPSLALRPRRSAPRPATGLAPARERGRLYRWTHPRFVGEISDELRKVVWPSRMETRNLTIVVIVVALAVGAVLGTADWGFNRLLERVLLP